MSDTRHMAKRPHHEPVELAFSCLMAVLLIVIFGFVAARIVAMSDLIWHTKGLLVVFLLLPPPLCFLLVRTYTQMIEDERVKALSGQWGRCESEFVHSAEAAKAGHAIEDDAQARPVVAETAEARHAIEEARHRRQYLLAMGNFVLKRHPALADLFLGVREGASAGLADFTPELVGEVARHLARTEIRSAGLNRSAYDLPILFFSFAYFAGVSLVLPFVESYVAQIAGVPSVPKTEVHVEAFSVPLMVFQLGFLGGGAYTAFNVISRFLARDISPRLFLLSGVRLLLAPVAAFMFFLLAPEALDIAHSRGAVLAYIVAGGFPFALLAASGGRLLSRINPRSAQQVRAGKQPVTEVDGIGIFTAQRLGEEGIEMIQHLAFCDATRLARRTRFADATVADWKDQALLYLLTADCRLAAPPAPHDSGRPASLYDLLAQRAGIRTMSGLLRSVFVAGISVRRDEGRRRVDGVQVREDIEAFFWKLGLLGNSDDGKRQSEGLVFFFSHLCDDALAMDPGLWRLFGVEPRAVRAAAGIEGV